MGEDASSFVPSALPPNPPIQWSPELRSTFDQAHTALGRLDSCAEFLPDISLFLYVYVRKEAVLSSMIEGTQSSLSDLLLFEMDSAPGVPIDDVQEVSNYASAMNYGLKELSKGTPISLRLLKELHKLLMSKGRGINKTPGEFRQSQNWIGGSRPGNAVYVPPPADQVLGCMGALELFLHNQPAKTSTLLKAAISHVQFETIHPFLDGNGRLGRSLLLCQETLLRAPLLYLSLYFKNHRSYYYKLLNNVRKTGDWEAWLMFFGEAVIETSSQAIQTAAKLTALSKQDDELISQASHQTSSLHFIHKVLLRRPIVSSPFLVQETKLSTPTVNACLQKLINIGIVTELTGGKRGRMYGYEQYIDIMNEEIV
jgi:Fic family protein